MTVPEEAKQGLRRHHRETRWQIWLPFIGAVLLTVLLSMLLVVLQDENTLARASAMASLALIVACLLPGGCIRARCVCRYGGAGSWHERSASYDDPAFAACGAGSLSSADEGRRVGAAGEPIGAALGQLFAPLDHFFERLDQFLKEQQHDREQG